MRRIVVLVSAILALLSWGTLAVMADGPNYAGVVVQYGDGRVETACVGFDEDTISGAELLARSGLDVIMDMSGGAKVCAIGGEGCQYPTESCFCQCEGNGPCVYWSYWHLDPENGTWQYSNLGAGAYQVSHGDVDGWRWGAGTPGNAQEPPALTFADVCAEVLPTPTATPGMRIIPSVTPEPMSPRAPVVRQTPTPALPPTPPPTTTPAEPLADTSSPWRLLAFGLFVAMLVGGIIASRRR